MPFLKQYKQIFLMLKIHYIPNTEQPKLYYDQLQNTSQLKHYFY